MFFKEIKELFTRLSAKKLIKEIFSEFTPEEMKILESSDCAIPYMYTTLLKEVCPGSRSRYSLEVTKDLADACIYCFREHLSDPVIQKNIYLVCANRFLEN